MEEMFKDLQESPLVCTRCGTHYADFEQSGLLGCPDCYLSFENKITSLLVRIHGSSKHIGSRPVHLRMKGSVANLNQLKTQLKTAITRQNYEEAARLRDLIKDIERQNA